MLAQVLSVWAQYKEQVPLNAMGAPPEGPASSTVSDVLLLG
jgi:hypothetical protein